MDMAMYPPPRILKALCRVSLVLIGAFGMAQEILERQGAGELLPGSVDRPLCVQTLAAGRNYTLAIDTEGALFGWGNNSDGQLDATKKEWLIPGRLREGNDWVAVVAGRGAKWGEHKTGYTAIAMNVNGGLRNLGLCDPLYAPPSEEHYPKSPGKPYFSSFDERRILPEMTIAAGPFEQVVTVHQNGSASTYPCESIYKKYDDGVFCIWWWPVDLPGSWRKVFGAFDNFAAIKTDGSLWTWGDNACGQIGNGVTGGKVESPTQIGAGTKWKEVAIGERHMLALDEAGKVWAWGDNTKGKLGNKSTESVKSPVLIVNDKCKSIAAGANHSLAVSEDGFLFAWGANSHGQLGKSPDGGVYNSPQVIPDTGNNWSKVYAGPNCCFAVQNGGALYSWGENSSAQLGHGDKGVRYLPWLVKRPLSY